ncbi:ATP-dependent DNA helicase pfh1 [Colletotrichum siamense]|nr:ATP-dependent DNA helicase pfh1 [Colletotrichum siamense]
MGKKRGLDKIKGENEPSEWNWKEADNYIERNRDQLAIEQRRDIRMYYVIYAGKTCGIFKNWAGPGGAEEQTGGGVRSISASTWEIAMQLLREGFARESMAGHLPRSPTKPQRTAAGSSVKAGNGFPSEASSSKRPRLNNPSKYPENSHDAFVASANNELRGEKSFDEKDEVAPPPPPELPPLCPEQQRALELAINGENLFITGSGGCGKSRLVKALYDTLTAYGKTVHLLAPTGQAAVNIGGRTIFSYIGWRPDDLGLANSTLVARARKKHIFSRIKSTEVLIIDEISMVERQVFERLSYVLSVIRRGRYEPSAHGAFGGVQIITVGDFCQLPPVKPFKYCYFEMFDEETKIPYSCGLMETSDDLLHYCPRDKSHGQFKDCEKWAFKSDAWHHCTFKNIHLTTIHRQKDEGFVRMLQNIRRGHVDDGELDLLLEKRRVDGNGTFLFSHKSDVKNHNDAKLKSLDGKEVQYQCLDHTQPIGDKKNKRDHEDKSRSQSLGDDDDKHRYHKCLEMKVNMPVILLSNIDVEKGLCNGSQGTVIGFVPRLEDDLKDPNPKHYKGDQVGYDIAKARCEQIGVFKANLDTKLYPEVRFSNGERRVIGPDCSFHNVVTCWKEIDGEVRLALESFSVRTQIPLVPGWAMTIHKSQSLSLDRVTVDLESAWDGRLIYVALSRARSLQGLCVKGSRNKFRENLSLDPEVERFVRDIEERKQDEII